MNEEIIKQYLDEYFKYVKTVFINSYSRFMTLETLEKNKKLNPEFKIDLDSKFKIYVDDRINICLNIDDFIIENQLMNDKNLKDISIDGKVYIKYLIDNKDDRVILNLILRPIILLFIGKDNDVIFSGVIDSIVDDIEKNYNMVFKRPFKSKELEVVDEIKKVVGSEILYSSIINNNLDNLRNTYNSCSENEKGADLFTDLRNNLNKEYDNYYKKIGKVYFSDTLYDYENLDYTEILKTIKKLNDTKINLKSTKKNRFISVKKNIENLISHRIIFEKYQHLLLKNAYIEVNNMIEKIDDNNIDFFYRKLLELENKIIPLTEILWMKQLTHPVSYSEGGQFCFLINNTFDINYIETKLFTDKHLRLIDSNFKINYGYIFPVTPGSIIYSSGSDILSREIDDKVISDSVIKVGKISIEIDNQRDSKLMTPDLLLRDNIRNNDYNGKVLLSPLLNPIAIYVLYENSFDVNIEKAHILSKKSNIPLIKINRNLYKNRSVDYLIESKKDDTLNSSKNTVGKKTEFEQIPKQKITDRIRKITEKMLYEEKIEEEFKKRL